MTNNPKRQFAVTFNTNGGTPIVFYRWCVLQADAVEEAKDGFQWRFGYWPNDPISVREITPDPSDT